MTGTLMEVLEVIREVGTGTYDDPVREVYTYYDMQGEPLAETDLLDMEITTMNEDIILAIEGNDK